MKRKFTDIHHHILYGLDDGAANPQKMREMLRKADKMLAQYGAVSEQVARAMASGAKTVLGADIAVSVTGLAGPAGDEFGNSVGTVYIGYADENHCIARHYLFAGDREAVRQQAVDAALQLILEFQ